MSKIKKGDEIIVITGKDKGRRGNVSRVLDGALVVEGINVAKRHTKGNPQAGVAGGIVEKEMPIDISNVALFNSKTGKADRVGFKFVGEGADRKKDRIFMSSYELVGYSNGFQSQVTGLQLGWRVRKPDRKHNWKRASHGKSAAALQRQDRPGA